MSFCERLSYNPSKDPPTPLLKKKHLLVQSRVERTAFLPIFFLIEYIWNFFHMNEFYPLLYAVLNKLSFSNLQFNYTPGLHRANF